MANQLYTMVINYNAQSRFCSNITHWRFDDSGFGSTLAAATALINAFASDNLPSLIDALPTTTTVLSLKARRSTGGQGFEAVKLLSAGNVGTRTGNTAASGAGPVILLYPSDPDGKHIGRMFLPGISINDLDGGMVNADSVTDFETAMGGVIDDLTLTGGGGPTADMVIPAATAAGSLPVNRAVLSPRVGTQRRRQRPY